MIFRQEMTSPASLRDPEDYRVALETNRLVIVWNEELTMSGEIKEFPGMGNSAMDKMFDMYRRQDHTREWLEPLLRRTLTCALTVDDTPVAICLGYENYGRVWSSAALSRCRRGAHKAQSEPGRQLQIDFGERHVEIAGAKTKLFLFVATLGLLMVGYPVQTVAALHPRSTFNDQTPSVAPAYDARHAPIRTTAREFTLFTAIRIVAS